MTQVFTGEGINYYQLATLKQAMKLESKGLKSRAGPLRPKWAAALGLKPRDSYDKYVEAIQAKMEEILAKQAQQEAEGQTKH